MMGQQNQRVSLDKEKVKRYVRENVIQPDPVDKLFWELITCVPQVSQPVAITSFILNIIVPGIGTILASCCIKNDQMVSKA